MLRITIEVRGETDDAQGIKEKLAVDFERYGDVKVIDVKRVDPEQMRIGEAVI